MEKKGIYVVDNDKNYINQISKVVSMQSDYYMIGNAPNGKEALIQLKTIKNIDILIVELVLPIMDGFALLNELKALYLNSKNKPYIIVHSGMVNQNILNMINNLGCNQFLLKPYDMNILLNNLKLSIADDKNTSDKKEASIEKQTTEILHEIGIPAHIKGYKYIRAAVVFAYYNNDFIGQVTKTLYPEIARKYKTTGSRVERAIRHAIELAWNRGDTESVNRIFGHTVSAIKAKPTNSEFIAMISDYLIMMNDNKVTM